MLVSEQELMTIQEVAKRLRVHPDTVRRMIKDGELRATRVRLQYRIYRDSVEQYLHNHETEGDK